MEQAHQPEERTYCFGEWRFLPSRQLLLHRETPVRIGSRALDLLHALVQRPGDLISKRELIRSAWPDVFVHDSNLKVNIAALRRALQPGGTTLPYIATVSGRGYRFVAPLTVLRTHDTALPVAMYGSNGDLPAATPLLGRRETIAKIVDAIGQARLLTIVGPAGVGKTSVAIAVAHEVEAALAAEVRFIDLAAIEGSHLVAPAIASALGLVGHHGDILAGLSDAVRNRNLLLVLDNCEHVLNGASVVVDHLCNSAPGLLVLTTSREPLRCRLETLHRLAPLACPPGDLELDGAGALAYPAFALLIQRAAHHGYLLQDADVRPLTAITHRLEGIPLAIELAAPRLPALGSSVLLDRLGASLDILVSEGDPATRHATLAATLDWSYRLLPAAEARLLRRMSVFGVAVTVEDVVGAFSPLESAEDLASQLESLSARSLLSPNFDRGRRNYRLLDSTRKFAASKLQDAGEARSAMTAYAEYLLNVFEQAERDWRSKAHADWLACYGRWDPDLHRVIEWAYATPETALLAVRLTAAGTTLWNEFSSLVESRRRVEDALEALDRLPAADPFLRLKLLSSHASNLSFAARLDGEVIQALRRSALLAQELGDHESRFRSVMGLVAMHVSMGDFEATDAALDEVRALMDATGDYTAAPEVDRQAAMLRFYRGHIVEGHAWHLRVTREHATSANSARTSRFHIDRFVLFRNFLAMTTWVTGAQAAAQELTDETLGAAATLDHAASHAHTLVLAAIPIALLNGDLARAQAHVTTLVDLLRRRPIEAWAVYARLHQATIDAAQGDAAAVQRMRTAVDQMRDSGSRVQFAIRLVMLANAAIDHDEIGIAQATVAEALAYSKRQGARWCDAEFLRLEGVIRWREGDMVAAEKALRQAHQLALKSGALSFALRAAVNRAKLAIQLGAGHPELADLAKLLNRFDEGYPTADVTAALALRARAVNEA